MTDQEGERNAYQWDEQGWLRGCDIMDGAGAYVRSVANYADALLNEDELLALSQREYGILHVPAHGQ